MKVFKDKDKIREMLVVAWNNGWIKTIGVKHTGCPVCGRSLMQNDLLPIYLHHRMHDKDGNRSRYPLFIHSPANLVPYHAGCQDEENWIGMSDVTADLYEDVLSQAKIMIREFGVSDQEMFIKEHIESLGDYIRLTERPEFSYHAFYLSVLILMN